MCQDAVGHFPADISIELSGREEQYEPSNNNTFFEWVNVCTANPTSYPQYAAFRGGTPSYLDDVTSKGFTGYQENAYIKLLYTKTSHLICCHFRRIGQ